MRLILPSVHLSLLGLYWQLNKISKIRLTISFCQSCYCCFVLYYIIYVWCHWVYSLHSNEYRRWSWKVIFYHITGGWVIFQPAVGMYSTLSDEQRKPVSFICLCLVHLEHLSVVWEIFHLMSPKWKLEPMLLHASLHLGHWQVMPLGNTKKWEQGERKVEQHSNSEDISDCRIGYIACDRSSCWRLCSWQDYRHHWSFLATAFRVAVAKALVTSCRLCKVD